LDESFPIAAWFVATRAIHFAACLLLFGVLMFDRAVAAPLVRQGYLEVGRQWESIARRLVFVALPAAVLSGASWFALVAINMSSLPATQALRLENLQVVWDQTRFGTLWKLRLALCLAIAVVSALLYIRGQSRPGPTALARLSFLLSGLLAASLAWSGHGQTGPWSTLHLLADTCHLLSSGCWGAGLLPFTLMLLSLRRAPAPGQRPAIARLTRRFSEMSLASVAVLALSGLVNSWLLVGSVSNLTRTAYGRVLMLKVALFCVAVGLACINRLWLKPRLLRAAGVETDAAIEVTAARLQFNTAAELVIVTVILIATAILGMLAPATA
jgi:putative copper resistance protein D